MSELEVIQPDDALPEAPPVRPAKLKDLANLWEVYVRLRGTLAPNTLHEYRWIGRRFVNYCGNRPMGTELLVGWMEYLRGITTSRGAQIRPISPGKVNSINVRIRGFLGFLYRFKYLSQDYSYAIPRLLEPAAKAVEIITEDQYNKIKAWCAGREWCQPHLWLIILGYRTGMSLIDCCHLRWRDVHLNHNAPSFIDIYRIKTQRLGEKALCQIPIVPNTDVHEWLMKLRGVKNYTRADGVTDYVHQDCPGIYAYKRQPISFDFTRIFRTNGVARGVTFRNLRSTFVSNLVNSDVQLALIMKMTGHQNAGTLLKYLRADRRALQDGLTRAFNYAASQAWDVSGHSGFMTKDQIAELASQQ